ncbi:hypothetical protein GCM10010191_22140 [Actinomadura vinacea]|uniref:CBS domain-containing protein n=1 Tax=Actinomadura vinacea TaxID=115336 RepID=A0ABN3ITW8_9ACTN
MRQHKIEKLPIVDDENRLLGLITVKDYVKSDQHPDAARDPDSRGSLRPDLARTGRRWPHRTVARTVPVPPR